MEILTANQAELIKPVIDQLPPPPAHRNALADMPDHLVSRAHQMRRWRISHKPYAPRETPMAAARRRAFFGGIIEPVK